MDNTSAISYINKRGGLNFTSLIQPCLRPLAMVPRKINHSHGTALTRVSKCHCRLRIPGKSRFQRLATGSISVSTTEQKRGPFVIDLFATRLTAQLQRFVSWKPDPVAEAVDAFTLDWSPPFALIGRCLRQIQQQSVPKITIVTPVWETQTWYPLLLGMIIDTPVLLPVYPGLLRQEDKLHPLDHLQLAAWHVSGQLSKSRQYHSQLKNFCWQHRDPGRKNLLFRLGKAD